MGFLEVLIESYHAKTNSHAKIGGMVDAIILQDHSSCKWSNEVHFEMNLTEQTRSDKNFGKQNFLNFCLIICFNIHFSPNDLKKI